MQIFDISLYWLVSQWCCNNFC